MSIPWTFSAVFEGNALGEERDASFGLGFSKNFCSSSDFLGKEGDLQGAILSGRSCIFRCYHLRVPSRSRDVRTRRKNQGTNEQTRGNGEMGKRTNGPVRDRLGPLERVALCFTRMWNSVSRAVGYGWSVGLSLIRKMSDKIFDGRSTEGEDISFVVCKMAEGTEAREKNRMLEQHFDPREQPKPEPDRSPGEISVLYDSLDETSSKVSGVGHKSTSKTNENHGKATIVKSDNRTRQKVSADVRWNHVGNGSNDYKWCSGEKLGKSQSDLSNSKWFSNVDGSVKSDFTHKSPSHALNSSESDIFPYRSGIPSNPNETSNSRPHPLFKSQSSSQLPSIRGNHMQSHRQWKCGSYSAARPTSAFSMHQTFATSPPYYSGLGSYGRSTCACTENWGKKNKRTESVLSLSEEVETPEGLSWRRLHMSRAKLKATATTSELLSGFAMVAMVELQINKPTAVPEWLFVLFAVCTTILVSVHIFALMISTYLLPNIDAVSKLHVSSLVTESPHDRMKSFIELAWAFSTILGLFLFLVEIAILCWVKFWDYSFTAAMSATMIIMPVLVLFVAFAMHFYHSLVVIKCKTSVSNMQELENMKKQLDNVCLA